MESPPSLWSAAAALGSALLGALVFIQTGLGVLKLRLELQKLRQGRKATAPGPEPTEPGKAARKPRSSERKIYRGAVIRWLLATAFLFLTVLSYLYLRADVARKQAEMARAVAEQSAKREYDLEERNKTIAKELDEVRALPQPNKSDGGSSDLSKQKSLSITGLLSNSAKAKAHRFSVGRDKVIVIQPKATSSAALYFDLTVQSPSGRVSTVERFKSIQGSAPFPYTTTESGEHLLLVTMRPDGGASAGPYLITITEQ